MNTVEKYDNRVISTFAVYDKADRALIDLFDECFTEGTLCTTYTNTRNKWISDRYTPAGAKAFRRISEVELHTNDLIIQQEKLEQLEELERLENTEQS